MNKCNAWGAETERGVSTVEGSTFIWMHMVDQGKPIYSIYYTPTNTNNIMPLTAAWTDIAATLLTGGGIIFFQVSVPLKEISLHCRT